MVVIGFAAGGIPQIPANVLLVKNIGVLGLYWGTYWKRAPERVRAEFEQLLAWWQAGKLKPVVSRRFPLDAVAAAMAELTERRATGKVVLRMQP